VVKCGMEATAARYRPTPWLLVVPLLYLGDFLRRGQEHLYRESRAKRQAEHEARLSEDRRDPIDEDSRRDDQSEYEGDGGAP
jgi:hypothetical protein